MCKWWKKLSKAYMVQFFSGQWIKTVDKTVSYKNDKVYLVQIL